MKNLVSTLVLLVITLNMVGVGLVNGKKDAFKTMEEIASENGFMT